MLALVAPPPETRYLPPKPTIEHPGSSTPRHDQQASVEILGMTTVDCLNAATCGGRLEMRLRRVGHIAKNGSTFSTFEGERWAQTCPCEYSEEEADTLIIHARNKLGLI